MAKKQRPTTTTTEPEETIPTFILRADNPRHIHALIAAAEKLPDSEQGEAIRTIREFDLWMETHPEE